MVLGWSGPARPCDLFRVFNASLCRVLKKGCRMFKIIICLSAVIGLSACGSIKLTEVKSSNTRTVVVEAISGDIQAALKLADTECQKYGRFARMSGQLPNSVDYVFDCVN